jgi:hypothetical protein
MKAMGNSDMVQKEIIVVVKDFGEKNNGDMIK